MGRINKSKWLETEGKLYRMLMLNSKLIKKYMNLFDFFSHHPQATALLQSLNMKVKRLKAVILSDVPVVKN